MESRVELGRHTNKTNKKRIVGYNRGNGVAVV